jgi:hypothetical protein
LGSCKEREGHKRELGILTGGNRANRELRTVGVGSAADTACKAGDLTEVRNVNEKFLTRNAENGCYDTRTPPWTREPVRPQ